MAEYSAVPPPTATPDQEAKIQEALARAKQVIFPYFLFLFTTYFEMLIFTICQGPF